MPLRPTASATTEGDSLRPAARRRRLPARDRLRRAVAIAILLWFGVGRPAYDVMRGPCALHDAPAGPVAALELAAADADCDSHDQHMPGRCSCIEHGCALTALVTVAVSAPVTVPAPAVLHIEAVAPKAPVAQLQTAARLHRIPYGTAPPAHRA